MIILKRYKDEDGNTWNETSLDECLEHTEGSGYWVLGSVKELLEGGDIVFTPNAEYMKCLPSISCRS